MSRKNPTLLSDGKALIEVNPNRFARGGFKLFSEDWKNTVHQLEKMTTVFNIDGGHLLSDPGGTWIYLIDDDSAYNYDFSNLSPSVLGNYAGLSLEVISVLPAMDIWQTLGFEKQSGSLEQGWISLSNSDGITLSLMGPNSCPHLFFNPSLTYFNGKENPAVIKRIRDLGIPITEEITVFNEEGLVDNIIIRDPDGYGFFIFND